MQERFLNNNIIGRTLLMETKNESEYLVNRFYYYVDRYKKKTKQETLILQKQELLYCGLFSETA